MCLHNRVFPMRQPVFHQAALIHLRRKSLTVRFDVIDREVLNGCSQFQIVRIVSLETSDVGDCHSSRQVRVLAEDLLNAAPERIAADIDDRRAVDQAMLAARTVGADVVKRPALVGHGMSDGVHQGRVPRCAHGDGCGKQRGWFLGPDSMKRLVPAAPGVDAQPRYALVEMIQLLRLLLERHAPNEIGDPYVHWLGGVTKNGLRACLRKTIACQTSQRNYECNYSLHRDPPSDTSFSYANHGSKSGALTTTSNASMKWPAWAGW